MPLWLDAPLHLTFEELERDELRRSEAIGLRHEDLFDGTFSDDPPEATNRARLTPHLTHVDDADDEE